MRYSRDFFALQISFAQKLAAKFGGELCDFLFDTTTFSKNLGIGSPGDPSNTVWQEYLTGLRSAPDAADWTYEFYLAHNGRYDGAPYGETFHGHPLFGCFYYGVTSENAVRPHFIKNDASGIGPLDSRRLPIRRAELKQMFRHIQIERPQTEAVVGSSWLYNLESYRRLFPPEFTANLEVREDDEFQYLIRWGQFFDKDWLVKPPLAQELFARLDAVSDLGNVRNCFPLPILQAGCTIECFYDFYGK